MILCLCEGLNDRILRNAVRSGACTVGALARRTKAGTGCGSCTCDLKRLIAEETTLADFEDGRRPPAGIELAASPRSGADRESAPPIAAK